MKFSCIVLAAGDGTRFGDKKQFISLDGKPLWEYATDASKKVSDDVVVVGIDVPGGRQRRDSVFIGLNNVSYNRVVIVEAARPLVTPEQIKRIGEMDNPSVSYYLPSVDTIIYGNKILKRDMCLRLQVPQAFEREMLLEAHRNIGGDATDDTILMQRYHGIDQELVEGGINLRKVTFPYDMDILEVIKRIKK